MSVVLVTLAVRRDSIDLLLAVSAALLLFVVLATSREVRGPLVSLALVSAPLTVTVPALRPDEYNYVAYLSLLLLVVGLLSVRDTSLQEGRWLPLPFLALLITSAVWSYSTTRGAEFGLLVMPLGALGLYLFVSADVDNASRLVGVLMLFGVLESLLGLSQTAFGWPYFSIWGEQVFVGNRNYLAYVLPGVSPVVRMAVGTYEHFNGLGSLLGLLTPIAYGIWRSGSRTIRHAGLILALFTAGLIATFSRGALLGTVVACLLIEFLIGDRRARIGRIAIMLWLGGVMFVVGMFMIDSISKYVATTQNLFIRLNTWSVGLERLADSPWRLLTGFGLGYFDEQVLSQGWVATRLHSGPLQILLELGLGGVAAFVVAVWKPIKESLSSKNALSISIGAGLIAFMVHQVVDNALLGWNGILFFGLIGALTGTMWPAPEDDNGRGRHSLRARDAR